MTGVLAAALLVLLAQPAWAHPEGFSGLRVYVGEQRVRVSLTLHTRDFSNWFPTADNPDYVADVCKKLGNQAEELVEIHADDQPAKLTEARAFSPEVGMIQVEMKFAISETTSRIQVWSKHLVRLPSGHQQLLFVEDTRGLADDAAMGSSIREDVLTRQEDSVEVELPRRAATTATTSAAAVGRATTRPQMAGSGNGGRSTPGVSFFWLGVEHIVTGYDHLLFLAALLLVCKNFRQAASVITFFTIAHSITLSLAALDIVRLPGRIVEPAIAASIVYVGLENIFGAHRFAWRALVTFGFGLVHGLGFASALREVGLGSTSIGVAWPLLKFSVGLETGQLVIAAILLRVLLSMRRAPKFDFERRWVPAGSVAVAIVGTYWLVTRVMAG